MGQQCHQLCILCHFYQFPCCWKAVSSCQCVSYALFFNVLPASPITCNSLWFINCHLISDSQKCLRFFFTSLEFSIILLSIKITVSRKNSPGKKAPIRGQGQDQGQVRGRVRFRVQGTFFRGEFLRKTKNYCTKLLYLLMQQDY